MKYAIKRFDCDGGGYVAPAGNPSSYVRELQRARTFASLEAAVRETCLENERVVRVDDETQKVS